MSPLACTSFIVNLALLRMRYQQANQFDTSAVLDRGESVRLVRFNATTSAQQLLLNLWFIWSLTGFTGSIGGPVWLFYACVKSGFVFLQFFFVIEFSFFSQVTHSTLELEDDETNKTVETKQETSSSASIFIITTQLDNFSNHEDQPANKKQTKLSDIVNYVTFNYK